MQAPRRAGPERLQPRERADGPVEIRQTQPSGTGHELVAPSSAQIGCAQQAIPATGNRASPIADSCLGSSKNVSVRHGGAWQQVHRTFGRADDEYIETITDPDMGRVILEKRERLSEHRNPRKQPDPPSD